MQQHQKDVFLIITRGLDQGMKQSFSEFPIKIGRDPSCGMVLKDQEVSRIHLVLKKRGRNYIISDLDSKNGCYINGEKVSNSTIKNGDKILIGNTEILFTKNTDDMLFLCDDKEFEIEHHDSFLEQTIIKNPQKIDKKKRLHQSEVLNQRSDNQLNASHLIDIYADLFLLEDLEEAAKKCLKNVFDLIPEISRSSFLKWSEDANQWTVLASKSKDSAKPFSIEYSSYQQILSRKQLISSTKEAGTQKSILILPLFKEKEILGVIHSEIDGAGDLFSPTQIEVLGLAASFCAPKIETLILRKEVDQMLFGMVEAMIATIEAKDRYTVGHSERVCRYSMAIADELKLNQDLKKILMISSLCHDIGKIGIPDKILKKASLLSPEEYEEMKMHPLIGEKIMSHLPNAKRFISGIKYHHEKWDGTGYPEGLQGEEIPFFGRIVAVADVFDAMVSGRSYSGFLDESDAIEKIQKESDLFDPEIIKALVKAFEKGAITQRTSTVGQKDTKVGKDDPSKN